MAVRQKKHKCPPHHFMINSENVGHCSCGEVRDFGKLLGREGFGVRSKSKNGGTRGKRGKGQATAKMSASAKKRWQNPEYRAKQIAAIKGRRHKKEEER
ncbi:hypothetical protein ES703_40888 [subsurface metagenome]|jgi:hypothetical protein